MTARKPPDRPAADPRRAGQATATAGRAVVATPGTPPVVPRDGDGVPGTSSPPSRAGQRQRGGEEAQVSRLKQAGD